MPLPALLAAPLPVRDGLGSLVGSAAAIDPGLADTAAFVVAGLVAGPLNPLMVTVRHERSPLELRGRVFSTYSAIAMAAQPVGVLVAGQLIDGIGFTNNVALALVTLPATLATTTE